MDTLLFRALLLIALIFPASVRAEIAVVVHSDSPVNALSADQVSDLYLGRAHGIDRGGLTSSVRSAIYDHPENSSLRQEFYRSLNGMSLRSVNSYWARLRFSGLVMPPEELRDSRAVLDRVKHDRSAIGYVDAELVDRSVKVVLRLR